MNKLIDSFHGRILGIVSLDYVHLLGYFLFSCYSFCCEHGIEPQGSLTRGAIYQPEAMIKVTVIARLMRRVVRQGNCETPDKCGNRSTLGTEIGFGSCLQGSDRGCRA